MGKAAREAKHGGGCWGNEKEKKGERHSHVGGVREDVASAE